MDLGKVIVDALRAAVGVPAAAYAISAIGLNLQFGYTGLLNFGHVGSMLLGAYGLAITVERGGPMWLGVLVGIGAALLLGLLLGFPTLRLRADFLAIVTIAAGEILRLVFRSEFARPLTGGVFGIQAFADAFYDLNPVPDGFYGIGQFRFDQRAMWVMTLGWGLAVVSMLVVRRLVGSPWGRVLKAVREDEDATASLGKNVFLYKMQSLMLGGVIGAFAGMVLAIDRQAVNPDFFIPLVTFYAFTIVIMGGPATITGPALGAVIFWFLFEFLDGFVGGAVELGWLGPWFDSTDVGPIRFAMVGLGLMLLMIFRPQGILGSREELLIDAR
jgi:neutral amino acid transport system permease protein